MTDKEKIKQLEKELELKDEVIKLQKELITAKPIFVDRYVPYPVYPYPWATGQPIWQVFPWQITYETGNIPNATFTGTTTANAEVTNYRVYHN